MRKIGNLYVLLSKGEDVCPECKGIGKVKRNITGGGPYMAACPVCRGARILERQEGYARQKAYYEERLKTGEMFCRGVGFAMGVIFLATIALCVVGLQ